MAGPASLSFIAVGQAGHTAGVVSLNTFEFVAHSFGCGFDALRILAPKAFGVDSLFAAIVFAASLIYEHSL